MKLIATPPQTVGPFFHVGCSRLSRVDIASKDAPGVHLTVEGRILDGDGTPVPDAMIEIWQADASGKYAHTQDKSLDPKFKGYARAATDQSGRFRFTTIKPGPVAGPDGTTQVPHLAVSIFMRGLMKRLVSRIYFPDDPANANDPILKLVDPARRKTLIARKSENSGDTIHWDIILQGKDETVFFDL
jgi:protocatechuate 3,4-dioxygenase alpha subunit